LKIAATGVLPALILGILVMRAHEAPLALPAINLASAAIGFLLLLFGGKKSATLLLKRPAWVASAVLCLQAITLASPGIEGVHRWISFGSVRLHPAAIGDPVLLLAVIILWNRQRTWSAISFVAVALALRVVQPDAGQATALAAGAGVLSLVSGPKSAKRLAMIAVATSGVILAWLRPDPLPPVDMVENIVARAFELSHLIGALSMGSLAMLPVAALWQTTWNSTRQNRRLAPATALAAYLSANILVVLGGEFPSPVLGFGASPILGTIFALGLLAHVQPQLGVEPKATIQ
jgi:cell division protein FtsW (lipid II flippase)